MRSSERELLLAERAQEAGEDEIEIVDKVELGIEELVDDHVAHTCIVITVGIERQLRAQFDIVGAARLARGALLLPGEVKRILAPKLRIERLQELFGDACADQFRIVQIERRRRLDDAHLQIFRAPKKKRHFHVAIGLPQHGHLKRQRVARGHGRAAGCGEIGGVEELKLRRDGFHDAAQSGFRHVGTNIGAPEIGSGNESCL
jgi:hypothetical protein